MIRDSVLTMGVDVTTLSPAVDRVVDLGRSGLGGYVCLSNVHMCMETFDSPDFASVVNQADLILPDGKPLSIAQQLLGHKEARQVRGQDIMNALCQVSGEKAINIGFYGGASEDILDSVKGVLRAAYPDIKITFAYAPPFRALSDAEDAEVTKQINAAEVDVLFVGIGCPKQENWMAEHKSRIHCVTLGVGAAFDFIGGHKKYAPRWVQAIGCEWLFRLLAEPKRLWKRYLKNNPRFIYYLFLQWVGYKFSR